MSTSEERRDASWSERAIVCVAHHSAVCASASADDALRILRKSKVQDAALAISAIFLGAHFSAAEIRVFYWLRTTPYPFG